jgi:methionine aminopeptidase
VPHYAKNKAVGVMKAGHAFTIEPMISEGKIFLGLKVKTLTIDMVSRSAESLSFLGSTDKQMCDYIFYLVRAFFRKV